MHRDTVAGTWQERTATVNARWRALTEDEIARVEGNCEVLEGKFQTAFPQTKAQVIKEVNEFLRGL